MAIRFACFICKEELNLPGALLISSPNNKGFCIKHHICTKCEKDLINWLVDKSMKMMGWRKRKIK